MRLGQEVQALLPARGLIPVAGRRPRCHGSTVEETSYPVTVLVRRPDGTTESVRVGTAVRSGDGFRLSLGELSIGATPDRAPAPAARASGPARSDGMVFPPYGRSKGAPIAGASVQDLEFYIQGSRRSLDDPSKSRFHEKERVLLAAMEAELARQRGGTAPRSAASGGGSDYGSRGGGAPSGSDRRDEAFDSFDDAPPFTDDDIPF